MPYMAGSDPFDIKAPTGMGKRDSSRLILQEPVSAGRRIIYRRNSFETAALFLENSHKSASRTVAKGGIFVLK